jgi:membrane protein
VGVVTRGPSRRWSNIKKFYDEGLWIDAARGRPPFVRPLVRIARLVVVVVLAFQDRLLNLHAMGLVYTTLLSLVPFLAVAFSVLKAFGAQYRLEPLLTRMLAPLGSQAAELTQQVVEFVTRMNVGVLGAIGLAGLFYTVVSLIGKIEDALNDIWKVRRARGLRRKFSDYLSVLLVGPVLVFAAFAIIASLRSYWLVQKLLQITRLETVTVFVAGHLAPFVLLAAAFTFLYRFLPYTRVHLDAAMVGGFTAAALWHVAGVAFTALVAGSASYSAIYSSFAVLILSLIWLQAAWLIVLVGGQVAYVHQHLASYTSARQHHGVRMREHIALRALVQITGRYLSDLSPYRFDELVATTGMPATVLEELVDGFVAGGILAPATEPEGIVLARPPEHLLVVDVLDVIWGAPPPDAAAEDGSADTVVDTLRKRDEVVREALRGITLRSLASRKLRAPDAVADLVQYRRA